MKETWERISVHWQQGKYQLCDYGQEGFSLGRLQLHMALAYRYHFYMKEAWEHALAVGQIPIMSEQMTF